MVVNWAKSDRRRLAPMTFTVGNLMRVDFVSTAERWNAKAGDNQNIITHWNHGSWVVAGAKDHDSVQILAIKPIQQPFICDPDSSSWQ
jgi:hypothetical protein